MTHFCGLVFSFWHIAKLCHRLLRKYRIQAFYLVFYVHYKLFDSYITTVHFKGSGTSPYTKRYVHANSTAYMCIYLFCLIFLVFFSVFSFFFFSLNCSFTSFSMLWKPACSINGSLNWYCPSWNFSHFYFSKRIFTLTDYRCCNIHTACSLLALLKNHSNSSRKNNMSGCFFLSVLIKAVFLIVA